MSHVAEPRKKYETWRSTSDISFTVKHSYAYMNHFTYLVIACMALSIMVAGCVQPSTTPSIPVPTSVTPVTPLPSATPLTDPALLGTWYLKAMTGPGGSSPVQTISPQMDATFSGQGDISGFAGCNHYSGQYILTGEALPNGWGISVGPVLSTLMYCAGTSDIEARFLSSLQNATSYSVTGDTLTITDHHGGALVFQRTAYGPTAVPRGL
ncbi:MAG: META domain protein [Methanoregulaceae archaeon PtaB.Bin009]|nr:MAG: META domain protein [Methanoregulaceae archaeon PtaB.Bin009]OPY38886.1 MAG: META domain protein [Methanoregulaceae archaeon PtaU1.Bin066]